jgi:hypothetical protein
VPEVEQAAAARLESWEPTGTVRDVCCDMCSPDAIVTMGIAQNVHFLHMSWQRFKDGCAACADVEPEVIDAFAQALALTVRRCPAQVQPMVGEVIARVPVATVKPETLVRLAHIVADLGDRDQAYAVLGKSVNVEGLKAPFYLALLRLATETMTPPDMALALDVNDRMVAAGFEQTAMSMRMLFAGMSRMVEPPVPAAVRLYQFRQKGLSDAGAPLKNVESCVTGCFFNVLDSAVGRQASFASDFVKSLPAEVVHTPIKDVCPEPPSMDRAGCFVADCTRYLLVDPSTVDLSGGAAAVPPQTYLLFLYSTLRGMAARRNNVCSANPFAKRLESVCELIGSSDQAVVLPYASELAVRAGLPDDFDRPASNQERMLAFISVIRSSQCSQFTAGVLSGDPSVARACAERGIECFRSLAAVPPLPSPGSTPPPPPQHQANGGGGGFCPNAGDRTAACEAMKQTFCGGRSC